MEKIVDKNFEQWSGLSDEYHNSRPMPPKIIVKIILSWLQKEPDTIIDIGCGTGLSTIIWNDFAKNIIGIEPNNDMRTTAEKNAGSNRIEFKKGVSNETNLPSECADIITVSQAFHWMDIDSTLTEFYRVLKKGGVLALYDFVLPPIMGWEIEKAYLNLRQKCSKIIYSQEDPPIHNDKSTYNDRIKLFGKFRHSREVECHSEIEYTPQKLMDLIVDISNLKLAMKIDATFRKGVDELYYSIYDLVRARYIGDNAIIFPYRIVIAIK